MKYYHIYPIDDLIEHEVDSHNPPCACNPRFEDQGNGTTLIIHDAMDRREVFERDYKKRYDAESIKCPECNGPFVQCGEIQTCQKCGFKRII